ncbi:MAG: hypothetical protein HY716_11400 [Planctomycetes bacterium]|nr:hypothetical protein [Planctomycetota bacterium]
MSKLMNGLFALASLSARRIVAGRRRWTLALIVGAAPAVGLGLVLASLGAPDALLFDRLMFMLHLYLAPILLAIIHGTAISSGEIEDGTAGYVLLGILPRWLAALTQILATGAALAAALVVGVGLTYAACALAEEPLPVRLGRTLGSHALVAALSVFVFLPFFAACGYVFKRGVAVGMVAVFVWEFMATFMPVKFAAYTLTNNVRVLWVYLYRDGLQGPFFQYAHGGWELPSYAQAARFVCLLSALFLAAAMIALSRRSIEGKEAR